MRLKFNVPLLILVLAAYSVSLSAQAFSWKNVEFSLSEGRSFFSSKSFQIVAPQSSTPIDGEMSIKAMNRSEARLNFLTTDRFGSEVFFAYGTSSVVLKRVTTTPGSISMPLQVHQFGLNVLYYPVGSVTSKWRPYVTVGGGAVIFRPTGEGQRIATDPLQGNLSTFIESSRGEGHAAVGIKRTLGKSFGIRAEIADVLARAPTFGLPATSDTANDSVLPVRGRINNVQASIGIILYLGR